VFVGFGGVEVETEDGETREIGDHGQDDDVEEEEEEMGVEHDNGDENEEEGVVENDGRTEEDSEEEAEGEAQEGVGESEGTEGVDSDNEGTLIDKRTRPVVVKKKTGSVVIRTSAALDMQQTPRYSVHILVSKINSFGCLSVCRSTFLLDKLCISFGMYVCVSCQSPNERNYSCLDHVVAAAPRGRVIEADGGYNTHTHTLTRTHTQTHTHAHTHARTNTKNICMIYAHTCTHIHANRNALQHQEQPFVNPLVASTFESLRKQRAS
jgi:hypothetical protein